jgi:hypothetical protein
MAIDPTVAIFDQFYNFNFTVNGDQYEIVFSFFKEYTSSIQTAQSFTSTLFVVANKTQINVLDLLETFKGANGDKIKVSLTMAYYLNTISNRTVMYGVNDLVTPNNLIQRNIVQ